MTEKEVLAYEQTLTESRIQHTCVTWFRKAFPEQKRILIAVGNGGYRPARTAATMKWEGQVAGVADLLLLEGGNPNGILCIEMKVPKSKARSAGKQSPMQIEWQKAITEQGNQYILCYGLLDFIKAVCQYKGLACDSYLNNAVNEYPLYLK